MREPRLAFMAVVLLAPWWINSSVAQDTPKYNAGDTVVVAKDQAQFVSPPQGLLKLPQGTKIEVARSTPNSVAGFAVIDGKRMAGWIRLGDVRGLNEPAPAIDAIAASGDAIAFQIDHQLGMVHHDLEFSPDGKVLLSASMHYESPDVRLWSTATGAQMRKLEGQRWGVRNGAFSPNGEFVAAANHGIQVWHFRTGQPVWKSLELSPVHRVVWSPDGKMLACVGTQGKVLFLDARNGEKRAEIQAYSGWTFDAIFMDDGKRLVTVGVEEPRAGAIKVFEVETGRLLSELRPDGLDSSDIALSPDEKQVLAVTKERTVGVWDLETGKPSGPALVGHKDILRAVAWSPDGRLLASAGEDRVVNLWDAAERKLLVGLPVECQQILDLEFSPDSRLLAMGSREGPLVVWRTAALLAKATSDAAKMAESKPPANPTPPATSTPSIPARTSPTPGPSKTTSPALPPRRTAAAGREPWVNLPWQKNPQGANFAVLEGPQKTVRGMALSADGRLLVTGGDDRVIRLWNLATGKMQTTIAEEKIISDLAFSPDGKLIAAALFSREPMAKIWDADTQKLLYTITDHRQQILCVAFSPDGKWLGTSDTHAVKIRNPVTCEVLHALGEHEQGASALVFSPDGSRLAAVPTHGRHIEVWDTATWKTAWQGMTTNQHCLAYSPDGRLLACGHLFGRISVWDAATGEKLHEWKPNNSDVGALAFSPDGTALVSGGDDRKLSVWTPAGALQQAYEANRERIRRLAFHPSGKLIVSAGGSARQGEVLAWRLASAP